MTIQQRKAYNKTPLHYLPLFNVKIQSMPLKTKSGVHYSYYGKCTSLLSETTTNKNQIFIEVVLHSKQRVTYQASIEESHGVRNPWTETKNFKHCVLWDDKRKDGKYTIISDSKLSDCVVEFSTPNGGYDKSSIERALTEIHNVLSLKEFYGNIKPKMFTERSGTHKTKPLLLN